VLLWCLVLYCPVLHRRTVPLGINPCAVDDDDDDDAAAAADDNDNACHSGM
jgi:hypothetical protein